MLCLSVSLLIRSLSLEITLSGFCIHFNRGFFLKAAFLICVEFDPKIFDIAVKTKLLYR